MDILTLNAVWALSSIALCILEIGFIVYTALTRDTGSFEKFKHLEELK